MSDEATTNGGPGANGATPVLEGRGLVKRYGQVVAMSGADFELRPNEVMAVIGDNGAGKSTLIKALSGGQRQGVAVARSAAFARHVVIMDEPTAALGVKESQQVLDLIRRVRGRGLPVILISHDMPHVWEVADRIHIQRLGKRIAVIDPKEVSSSDGVAIMTGAMDPSGVPSAVSKRSDA